MSGQALLLIGLIYVGIFGSLSALVYWDANRRGLDSPAKWAGFVFITGGTGFLLYVADTDGEGRYEDDAADPYSLPGSTPADRREGGRDSNDTE
ncbi:hypothetical protein [Halopiger xanaduensis]|uniref:Uncharacterized protein n=1 Tax=Halopiger xanaduensis (strain DSM 18323 / JCM 14033 / SH-6) TaxID=797210 RepID=F8D8M1_HALXS|nr:hypothetical protein [Halopiger xanaduensis]AEH36773.1 hypothetical protein Halxa_2148 [Halopiger xanaduensis SH-6]